MPLLACPSVTHRTLEVFYAQNIIDVDDLGNLFPLKSYQACIRHLEF
jgi:hypothetical protein